MLYSKCELSVGITIVNGIKLGDISATIPFSIYFTVMCLYTLANAVLGLASSLNLLEIFNLRRFNVRSKTFQTLVHKLLYANDADLVAHTERNLQMLVDRFSTVSTVFEFIISLKKQVIFTPPPGVPYSEPNIYVNHTRLVVMGTFVYLGSTLSWDGSLNAEIHIHIQKASVTFGRLEKWTWPNRGVTFQTKVKAYQTRVC